MSDETTATGGEIVSDKEALRQGHDLPGLWLKKIKRAKADEHSWHEAAEDAVEIYEACDEGENGNPAFNILHSNIEITVPSLYNSTPVPDVRRRFGDLDQIAKVAVDVIERALSYSVDQYDFDGTMLDGVRDAELAGRGVVRIRYKPHMDGENVGYQEVVCEHVVWNKWGHGPARHWAEVPWIYFEHDFTHADLRKLGVSEERIKTLGLDSGTQEDKDDKASAGVMKTCRGYEIWDKEKRQVLFVAQDDKREFLRAPQDDPLKLEQFFPIPKAMQPLRRRRDLTPIVPYEIYKTQVAELDKCTKRINSLIGQLRVRGLYDKRIGADLERLRFCEDGQYEPADDATMFTQGGGGLEKAIAHWPMEQIVGALQQLYLQRDQVKQTIYEITGLSDVLRGATNPNETLGAQQLKAQQGSTRLSQRQRMVAECCRELFRMKAEIICNHFTTENLSAMTGVQITPEVEQVLRSDLMRSYRIDIETDSTVRADMGRMQEQMSLFLQSTAQYASAMAPIIQLEPGAKAGVIEIYAAFARQYKLGKSAEDALDRMIQAAQQPEEPKPSPEQEKMKLEQQKAQMQAQMDQQKGEREMQKMQAELQMKQQLAEIDRQMKMLDLQVAQEKARMEIEKAQMELGMKREAMALDQQAKVFDIQTRQEISAADAQARREKTAMDMEARQQKADFEADQREAQAKQGTDE